MISSVKTEYLHRVLCLEQFTASIEQAKFCLGDKEFDAIAVTGNSGTLYGGALSVALLKPLILVRKPHDSSHSCSLVEGDLYAKRILLVDDFMCSGSTLRRIAESIKTDKERQGIRVPHKIVGYWLYGDAAFGTLDDLVFRIGSESLFTYLWEEKE